MSKPVPQFTPKMLRAFLQVRSLYQVETAETPKRRKVAARLFITNMTKKAGVTHDEMQRAWRGWLTVGAARTRLWRALDIDPMAHRVRLLDGGGQEVVE